MQSRLAILGTSACLLLMPIAHAKPPATQTQVQPQASSQSSATNLQKATDFFQLNQKKPGIQMLPNGVQYKILKNGEGNSPTAEDYVSVYYKATFLNGSLFKQVERSQAPSTLELSATIPGLAHALQQMQPGARWMVYIPPQLAYGIKGLAGKVPSNSALIFDIELVAIIAPPNEEVTGVLEELKEN